MRLPLRDHALGAVDRPGNPADIVPMTPGEIHAEFGGFARFDNAEVIRCPIREPRTLPPLSRESSFTSEAIGGGAPPPIGSRQSLTFVIFQMTPVPGICTSGPSPGVMNFESGSLCPKSRTAP